MFLSGVFRVVQVRNSDNLGVQANFLAGWVFQNLMFSVLDLISACFWLKFACLCVCVLC